MSIVLNTKTAAKKEVADILRAIATWMENSGNKTINVSVEVHFNDC